MIKFEERLHQTVSVKSRLLKDPVKHSSQLLADTDDDIWIGRGTEVTHRISLRKKEPVVIGQHKASHKLRSHIHANMTTLHRDVAPTKLTRDPMMPGM